MLVKGLYAKGSLVLLTLYCVHFEALSQSVPNWQQVIQEESAAHKEEKLLERNEIFKARNLRLRKKALRFGDKVEWAEIRDPIFYHYNYDGDDVNFTDDIISLENAQTKRWVVLTNFHGNMPLNLTNTFDRTKRTLSWATPYVYSKEAFDKLGSPHSRLALPKGWSTNQYRKQISFILIPPGTPMSFKIGYAKEQKHLEDPRDGLGVQMRLQFVPEGSLVLTTNVLQKQQIGQSKEEKQVDVTAAFVKALNFYFAKNPKSKINRGIWRARETFESPESFIEKNFMIKK